jgi:hypothetical protein
MTTQDGAAQPGSSIDSRLGCSTISFRAWTLPGALADISGQGFGEIDLGALPGVCDHVPTPLPAELVDLLTEQILATGLAVKLITADVAGMNDPDLDAAEVQCRLRTLVDLAGAVGTSGQRTAHRTVQRHRDGGSHPHRGRRSSSAASAMTSRMSTSPTPCRRPRSRGAGRRRATPAISPSSWRPATSPTPTATGRAAQLISGLI